ncbi:hypothetical protein P4V41_07950 [Fictibacillus nanhaiensis]|uniref:hypothetical protein n=1 Tax=Fictibacillus nanhaiensis TaxID=742169 RepID=UPI002E1D1246|nr:hypothetical protein [Fictibacillus nanhaiensis]
MNDFKFAMETTGSIIEKMKQTRLENDNRSYKTLSNTLQEIMHIFWSSRAALDKVFLSILSEKLESEVYRLQKVANESIGKGDYKSHHDWVIAYQKITKQLETIQTYLRREKSHEKLVSAKRINHSELQSTHKDCTIVSNTQSEAFELGLRNIKNTDSLVWNATSRSRLEADGIKYTFHGLNKDLLRGKKGDLLSVDRNIPIRSYMEVILPIKENFTEVNIIK